MGPLNSSESDLATLADQLDRIKTSRRLPRLHFLSWIVLLISSVSMVVIVVPGIPGRSTEYVQGTWHGTYDQWVELQVPEYKIVDVWSHGWPFEYARRPIANPLYDVGFGNVYTWRHPASWPDFKGSYYYFSQLMLLLDVVVGASLIVVFLTACEFWQRRRPGFRFKLIDIGVLATFTCLVLGWVKTHDDKWKEEQASVVELNELKGRLPTIQTGFYGPDWLRRLVGSPYRSPFNHIESLRLDSSHLVPELKSTLERLTYVKEFHYRGNLTPESVDVLVSLKGLNILGRDSQGAIGSGAQFEKPEVSVATMERLKELPQLHALRLAEPIQAEHLLPLAEVPRLRVLHIRGHHLLIDDLDCLDASPQLIELHLDISASAEELAKYKSNHPHLQVHWDQSNEVDPLSVVQRRIARWGGYAASSHTDSLDFTGALLTRKRLDRLPLDLKSITELTLGECDSPETAAELIRRCGELSSLDTRHVQICPSVYPQFEFIHESNCELYMQQGSLTAEQLKTTIKRLRPEWICLFNSSLTMAEGKEIEDLTIDGAIGRLRAYSGSDEDLDEQVFPDLKADPNYYSPFF